MSKGDPVLPTETIIRRFDPKDEKRCTFDDAGGPSKLKGYALRWDVDDAEAPTRKECSVYEEGKLLSAGLKPMDCVEDSNPDWSIATAHVSEVVSFVRASGSAQNPFSVEEDTFPSGEDNAPARDIAHANIVHAVPLRGSDAWYRDLALKFVPVA